MPRRRGLQRAARLRSCIFANLRERLRPKADGRRDDVRADCVSRGLEHACDAFSLLPDRRGVDVESFAPHNANLTLERKVIQMLADGDIDREVECVATTSRQTQKSRSELRSCYRRRESA